jgi:hypothetical protein
MQRALLDAAEAAGAIVRRDTAVVGVEPGDAPAVWLRTAQGEERVSPAWWSAQTVAGRWCAVRRASS